MKADFVFSSTQRLAETWLNDWLVGNSVL
jgi:hypothetical protein